MDLEKFIKKREMRTVQVELTCPECEKGMMMAAPHPVGHTDDNEPIFLHTCNNKDCEEQMQITKPYPHITHELKEEPKVLRIEGKEEE